MSEQISLKKDSNESNLQYIWRLCSLKDAGIIKHTWPELTDILNHELSDKKERLDYTESTYRKKYQQAKAFYDEVFSKMVSDEYYDQISNERRELQKERWKLQSEKLEYNRWLRENARDELFEEKVINAIREYSVNSNPPPKAIVHKHNDIGGVLCISDIHFGKQFKIYGLHNEIINEYSPEIFYSRMEQVYNDALEQIQKYQLSEIHIYNLGDHVDGFLRNSQLWSLRWGVIDSAIIFGNYMGDWLRKLSEDVFIYYHQTDGNHDELRLLDGRKGEHLCESAGKIIKNCIKVKNENNPNFHFIENQTGLIFDEVCGYQILGIHGEVKDLTKAVRDYSDIYNVNISYLIAGHKHHIDKNCGARKGCIAVGSLMGNDDFSMQIRQTADATTSFIVFERGKGKVDEHTCILN